jgi:hypothetical protein
MYLQAAMEQWMGRFAVPGKIPGECFDEIDCTSADGGWTGQNIVADEYNHTPFKLVCDDLQYRNILVTEEGGKRV